MFDLDEEKLKALFDQDKLNEEKDAFEDRKGLIRTVGNVADAFGRVPSMGALMLRRQHDAPDYAARAESYVKDIEDPWARRKTLLDQWKAQRDTKNALAEDKLTAENRDPNSEQAKKSAQFFEALSPKFQGLLQGLSIEQQQQLFKNPGLKAHFDSVLDQQRAERDSKLAMAREERLARKQADRDAVNFSQQKELAGLRNQYDVAEKKNALLEKKKTAMAEIETRRRTIDDNIKRALDLIEEDGTWEALGSHNQVLDGIINEIATDAAKLSDPESVARPSEVEQAKKSLVESGFGNRNATAQEILENFRDRSAERVKHAYVVRGLQDPGPVLPNYDGSQPKLATSAPQVDEKQKSQALAWAESNPNDPRAQEIIRRLETLGTSAPVNTR